MREMITLRRPVPPSVTALLAEILVWQIFHGKHEERGIEIREDEATKVVTNSDEKVKAKYSIEYLKKMIGGAKLSENVEIRFNNDYPLRLDFKRIDKLALSFILAPRVENE